MNKYFIYILRCADNTLYTGYTTNIEKRIATHTNGKGAKYTRGRLPVNLVYSEILQSESEAKKREYALKKMTKKQKETIIQGFLQF